MTGTRLNKEDQLRLMVKIKELFPLDIALSFEIILGLLEQRDIPLPSIAPLNSPLPAIIRADVFRTLFDAFNWFTPDYVKRLYVPPKLLVLIAVSHRHSAQIIHGFDLLPIHRPSFETTARHDPKFDTRHCSIPSMVYDQQNITTSCPDRRFQISF